MSAPRWTPGPWRAAEFWSAPFGPGPHKTNEAGQVFWGYSISGSNEHGGSILPTLGAVHNFPDNIHANAALIAAAPELYSALSRLLATTDPGSADRHMPDCRCVYHEAVAALAKARGETP